MFISSMKKYALSMRQLARFCLPLIAVSVLLAVLVSRQGLRFKISEASSRLDGTYQIVLYSNTMLDKNTKPTIRMEPRVDTETITAGNRITVITKEPLLADTSYSLTIYGAKSATGQQQTKDSVLAFKTGPAIAYGIWRNGGEDSIQQITIKDGVLSSKIAVAATNIAMMGNSPNYLWWNSVNDDDSHTLYVYDKDSKAISAIPIPEQSTIESLSVSQQTNDAVCIVTSKAQIGSAPLADEHSVYVVSADQKSVTKQQSPMSTAAMALISPGGDILVTQGRDGSVYAKSMSGGEPTPIGRTRLIGPFSGDNKSLMLRTLDGTSVYRLDTGKLEQLASIPSYATQVQNNFMSNEFVFTLTDFNQSQSGIAKLYQTKGTDTPLPIFSLPAETYSSRITPTPLLQYTAIETFEKNAQFDAYPGNSKAANARTIFIASDGSTIGDEPLIDVQWQ